MKDKTTSHCTVFFKSISRLAGCHVFWNVLASVEPGLCPSSKGSLSSSFFCGSPLPECRAEAWCGLLFSAPCWDSRLCVSTAALILMSSLTLLLICKMGILVDSFGLKTMKMLQVKVHIENLYKNYFRDLSGGSVVKNLTKNLPRQGVWVWSLVRKIRSHRPHSAAKLKKKNHWCSVSSLPLTLLYYEVLNHRPLGKGSWKVGWFKM